MRIAVVGAGVGGLCAAVRLAHAGHEVTVLEQQDAAGGKCARVTRGGFTWDAGPSLVTLPQVFRDLFAATGAPLDEELELLPVEPVTRYRFADGSRVDLSADLERSVAALEAWSPGAGADWRAFMAEGDRLWAASQAFLTGPPPWPPRRPARGDPAPDPRDALRVRPWWTLRRLARATVRDPRLRLVVERFATYAGADPRRAPAAFAVAGHVEHAFGAWHPRGGVYELVAALVRRLEAVGGDLRTGIRAEGLVRHGARVRGVETSSGALAADAVVTDVDELVVRRWVGQAARQRPRSVSGLAVLLGLERRGEDLVHHEIAFPADYDAEFDDCFARRRPVRDPTVYVCTPAATDPDDAPPGREARFVLVNAPAGVEADWAAEAERLVDRLGVRERLLELVVRSPADLTTRTGAVGGAIYGPAPHGRLGALRRTGQRLRGVDGLWLVGGTVHPGGGLPLVALGAQTVARAIGPSGASGSRPSHVPVEA